MTTRYIRFRVEKDEHSLEEKAKAVEQELSLFGGEIIYKPRQFLIIPRKEQEHYLMASPHHDMYDRDGCWDLGIYTAVLRGVEDVDLRLGKELELERACKHLIETAGVGAQPGRYMKSSKLLTDVPIEMSKEELQERYMEVIDVIGLYSSKDFHMQKQQVISYETTD